MAEDIKRIRDWYEDYKIEDWCRGIHQASKYTHGCKGLKFKREELVKAIGEDQVRIMEIECADYVSAIVLGAQGEPAISIRKEMKTKGISNKDLAKLASLNEFDVENMDKITSIHPFVSMAKALGLNPITIGFPKMFTL